MQLQALNTKPISYIYKHVHPKVKIFGMVTGGFVVGYELLSLGKYHRIKHPLGLQYVRDDYGKVHPMLTEWVWGADVAKVVKLEKAKVMTISSTNTKLKGLFVEFNAKMIVQRVLAERFAVNNAPQENGSEDKAPEDVENQRFPGEVGLTDEEVINRVMKFKEFAQPTLH